MFKLSSVTSAVMLAASATLLVAACGGSDSSSPVVSPPGTSATVVDAQVFRSVKALDTGWKFVQDDVLTDEQALAASGATWESVKLPHTWNASDAATTAQSTPYTQLYKRGLGWYRLEVDGNAVSGATKWLQFDAASIAADVWINGVKLGQHKGAFTSFRFDVSSLLKPGKNVIVVKTDNRRPTLATDATAIAPLSGDFNMAGGLYRGVSLIGTPATANIALGDLGGTGVYARTVRLSGKNASVTVQTKLENA
ncbi:MAG: sugar-binding domain-containing protein, partial [Pseudomonadota bacterium]